MRSGMCVDHPDQCLVDSRKMAVSFLPGLDHRCHHFGRDIITHKMTNKLCRDKLGAVGMGAQILDDVDQLAFRAEATLLVCLAKDHMLARLMFLGVEPHRIAFLTLFRPAVFPPRHDIGQRHHILLRVARRRRHCMKLQQFAGVVFIHRGRLAALPAPHATL